jgi:hypothetical protein
VVGVDALAWFVSACLAGEVVALEYCASPHLVFKLALLVSPAVLLAYAALPVEVKRPTHVDS